MHVLNHAHSKSRVSLNWTVFWSTNLMDMIPCGFIVSDWRVVSTSHIFSSLFSAVSYTHTDLHFWSSKDPESASFIYKTPNCSNDLYSYAIYYYRCATRGRKRESSLAFSRKLEKRSLILGKMPWLCESIGSISHLKCIF